MEFLRRKEKTAKGKRHFKAKNSSSFLLGVAVPVHVKSEAALESSPRWVRIFCGGVVCTAWPCSPKHFFFFFFLFRYFFFSRKSLKIRRFQAVSFTVEKISISQFLGFLILLFTVTVLSWWSECVAHSVFWLIRFLLESFELFRWKYLLLEKDLENFQSKVDFPLLSSWIFLGLLICEQFGHFCLVGLAVRKRI